MTDLNQADSATGAQDIFSPEVQWGLFVSKMRKLAGVDLQSYKPDQMHRRLASLMKRMGAADWFQFARILERDPAKLKEFKDFFTINVSEFFRGADKFLHLANVVIPELAGRHTRLTVWSAGCSVGAEPYTLAMIVDKLGLAAKTSILATDIDQTVLERAARGDGYGDPDVREVPAEYLAAYFSKNPDGWELLPKIKSAVKFKAHDLFKDPYPASMDLIVCRNVVIYFTDEAKGHIYRGFYNALRPGGYLFVGGTEIIPKAREMGFEAPQVYFYRRPIEPGSKALQR